jgi:site-specific DNA-cytosine methylase
VYKNKCLVLFDGAGLARLGLERAGWSCLGVELDPWKHHLSQFVGSGNCILADATDIKLDGFQAVWASPPCQWRSSARTQGDPISEYAVDYLEWCLNLPHEILWVENIVSQKESDNQWGIKYNAAQFLEHPIQNRNRIIGGRYPMPFVYREYKKIITDNGNCICPCVSASEYKGCASDARRASRFYGRKLTIEECAYHQGFTIPEEWYNIPDGFTKAQWYRNIYEGLGNAVPTYLSYQFGLAAKNSLN